MDISSLNLAELKKLQKDVEKAIATYEERQKAEALAAVEAKAKEMGFNLNDLLGQTAGKRKTSTVKPKYANPADASMTWTGRGRKPKWVIDALAAGKSLDDLAI